MKNLMISFITLLVFLHTTSYYMISTEAQGGLVDPVLDTDGNPLLSDDIYHVVPGKESGGGRGIVPYLLPHETCINGVSQLLHGVGNPLAFQQPSPLIGSAIFEGTDLNITFSKRVGCGSTEVWRRGEYDEASGLYFVRIGSGVAGNSEYGKSIGNAFQIRKAEGDFYKFVYCPKTCVSCFEKCDDVGISFQDGVKVLAVTDKVLYYIKFLPFYIKFRKVVPELATH